MTIRELTQNCLCLFEAGGRSMLNGVLSPDRVTLNWLLIWVREEASRLADAEGR